MNIPQEFLQESSNSRVQDDNSDAVKRALTDSGDEGDGRELVRSQKFLSSNK